MMPDSLPPASIYFLGALLIPFFRGQARQVFALLVPLVGFANYFTIDKGIDWTFELLDFELILGRADAWSLIFLNIFTILSFVGILYIVRDNKALDLSAGLLYAGSAMGVVMAGDLVSMFFFWEMLTLGAVMCIVARNTESSGRAAYRYLLVHVLGGVLLLAGLTIHIASGGSTAFDEIELAGPGAWLMFIGFGINCAWPVIGSWLTDTYPEASYGGLIFMATYTTKTAIYVLARTFPGEEVLLWIGLIMVTLPLLYAAIENDLRRVLAYCLINQVGFMVVGIGLGKELSLNGTAAHAYCHILYKALLFMAVGSVLYRTGKSKATELGGLYKSMPVTALFCCIGALSTSAPLFCGFVSKSLIMSTAAKEGEFLIWAALLFASAGVFLLAGLKVLFFAFFSKDSGTRCEEAPPNQLLAMGIVAVLSLLVGSFPDTFLYPMLPFAEVTYEPYTVAHVTDQITLLLFSGLAFTLLIRSGFYPAEIRSTNLDFDVLYRKTSPKIYSVCDKALNRFNEAAGKFFIGKVARGASNFFSSGVSRIACHIMTPLWKLQGHGEQQIEEERHVLFKRAKYGAFPIGVTALFSVVLLGLLAVVFLLRD
jgi:multicomponent Na+:H+ antiporter subunit D